MDCAEVLEAFKPLSLTSRPKPEAPDAGVLLKSLYSGLCHSDLHYIDDNVLKFRETLGDKYAGQILGHEICGRVEALGQNVPASCPLKVGDRVIVFPWRGCGKCDACLKDMIDHCEVMKPNHIGLGQPGGFSTYVPLEEWRFAIKIPDDLSAEVACMLPCSILTAYSAILKATPALEKALVARGVANLLIIGTGGLGLWAIALAKSVLAGKNVQVIAADVSNEKLDAARAIGADDTLLWAPDAKVEELIPAATKAGQRKMDASVDFVGVTRTATAAVMTLYNSGIALFVGLHGGMLSLPVPLFSVRRITLEGVFVGNMQNLRKLVDLFSSKKIANSPVLELYKLADINDAVDRMRKGEVKGRALIKFDE